MLFCEKKRRAFGSVVEEEASWLVSVFEEFVLLRFAGGGGIDFGVEAGMELGGAETFFPDFVDKPRGKEAMFMLELVSQEGRDVITVAFVAANRFFYCSPSQLSKRTLTMQQQKCP